MYNTKLHKKLNELNINIIATFGLPQRRKRLEAISDEIQASNHLDCVSFSGFRCHHVIEVVIASIQEFHNLLL